MAENNQANIAVVGATGAVGEKIVNILEDKDFPVGELKLLSSKRSAGRKVMFNNQELTVEEAEPESCNNIDVALFSAGGSVSKRLARGAVKRGEGGVDSTRV